MTEQNKIVKGVYIADDEDDLREIITNQHYYLKPIRLKTIRLKIIRLKKIRNKKYVYKK